MSAIPAMLTPTGPSPMPKGERPILISEVYGPVIQGEGALIGKPTVFVRTGGCDYRCSWCDTPYAVLTEYKDQWTPTSTDAVLEMIAALTGGSSILVTLSGGNPALQPLDALIERGHERGHTFAIETQGSVSRPWFSELDYLTLSPKPPSSGMTTDYLKLAIAIGRAGEYTQTTLKVVVFDDADYAYALDLHARYSRLPMVLQVGNAAPKPGDQPDPLALLDALRRLQDRVLADRRYDIAVLPQLHTLLFGNARAV